MCPCHLYCCVQVNLKACAPSFCSELEGRFKLFLGTYDNYPVDRENLEWLQSFVGRVLSGFFKLVGARHAASSVFLKPIGPEAPAIPIAERERRFIESLGKQQETHIPNDPRFPAQIPAELPLSYAACSPPLPSAHPRSDCMGSSLAGQDKTDISLSTARDGISGSIQIPQIPLLFAEWCCCKAINQIHGFITNGAVFHSVFLRHGILQPIHRLLHSPHAEYSGKSSSILLSLSSKSFKLFASSQDKAQFNKLVELMYSPQAIVRNNASEIIEVLAEGRGIDEEGE
ncbi:uncharacterized protein MONOS_4532 [Monocercomonoides exilis]|uniref:uncharacterized protein n=1 Tax=Monocercomonoides exilis TaxID=2049356 RepID=UPI00355A3651|nr:hypothetical protein MONOS_4532 [Monocercomonoides exilis]|eukprot:MONOS_4532.1-p1 / transcript=MONOS_4532.1 / gene=MONOS_4532 / organism=Monocercomonoides_exilis_PA203 / gene_product=unspecified product / transcript_product=unspecified product / location=Mono_scaffold00121:91440-93140(-) / protein_length=286 / sequence_SO=supercontig / SO=protein_coding / is_pseudo=false